MTDYSNWALKDEDKELLFGPVKDTAGLWTYVYKKENGKITALMLDEKFMALDFKSPDGGDTIERIKEVEDE